MSSCSQNLKASPGPDQFTSNAPVSPSYPFSFPILSFRTYLFQVRYSITDPLPHGSCNALCSTNPAPLPRHAGELLHAHLAEAAGAHPHHAAQPARCPSAARSAAHTSSQTAPPRPLCSPSRHCCMLYGCRQAESNRETGDSSRRGAIARAAKLAKT